MKMVLLVRLHFIFVVLLWAINSRAAAASADYAIAKPNCTAHCGGLSIPYPFGIGPNSSCYFDDWFQIDCHNSTTPILRRSKLEVLNVSKPPTDTFGGVVNYYYTLRVKNPVTFFNCKGKEIRQAANLSGSPFVYSHDRNTFVAVSCGFLFSVSSDVENVVGSCTSNCDTNSFVYNDTLSCPSNINCCETSIPPDLTVINSSIQAQAGKSRMANCDDYAFLIDQDWLRYNYKNFTDVKKMDSVPVILDWSLSLDNNKSLIKLFEGFSDEPRRNLNRRTPTCWFKNATGTYNNRSTVTCECPSGFEGNPYLLQTCQDIDECKDPKQCIQPHRSLATYFIVSMQEDRLFNILDARVVNEGSKEDIMIVANLARRCLNLNGRNRPTMREVTAELEGIQMSNRTHQGAELIAEVHYPIEHFDDVVSSSTGSTWDSGPASSLVELPQSSM